MDADAPEMESVEAFVEFLMDEDRTSFTFAEVTALGVALRRSTPKLIADLEAYGLTYEGRETVKVVRGFTSNSHDRWYGPGACRTHGGSGWEQVSGFAGQEG